MNTAEPSPVPSPNPQTETSSDNSLSPSLLIWSMAAMSLMLCFLGVGLIIFSYWTEFSLLWRLGCLAGLGSAIWGVYALCWRWSIPHRELRVAFVCVTWLLLIVAGNEFLRSHAFPLTSVGLVFLLGLLAVALLMPSRSAMALLALGCLFEVALLALASYNSGNWLLLIASLISLLMLWSEGGAYGVLKRREDFASISLLGQLCLGLTLIIYQLLLLYPSLLPLHEISMRASWMDSLSVAGIWALPMLLSLRVHQLRAKREHCSMAHPSALLYLLCKLIAMPLSLLLLSWQLPLIGVLFLFLFAMAMVYYGAEYHEYNLVFLGAAMLFVTALSIPLSLHAGSLLSGMFILLLGAALLYAAIRLHRHYRRLEAQLKLAKQRQLISQRRREGMSDLHVSLDDAPSPELSAEEQDPLPQQGYQELLKD